MLRLFRAAAARPSRSSSRTFLRIEALEARDQPDGGIETAPPPAPPGGGVEVPPPNVAPVIENFTAQEIGNGMFLITGRVIDETPTGMIVTFGGTTSAAGQYATVSADGTFSKIVQLRTDGTDSGYITATTVDAYQVVSEEVDVLVNPTPP